MSAHYLETELYEWFQSSKEPLDFIQGGPLDGMWFRDLERPENAWYSPAFCRLLGFEPHEVPTRSAWWSERILPEDLSAAMRQTRRHQDDPSHPSDHVVRFRHRDGSTVWVRCRAVVLRDDAGRAVRVLGAHTDVSAVERMALAHRATRAALERSNADLDRFAQIVAHDLPEPLRTVGGMASLLADHLGDRLDGEAAEMVRLIMNGCNRMTALLRDLLAYSQAGTDLRRQPVNLDDLVTTVLDDLAERIERAAAQVEVAPLPLVHGDPDRIRLVFQNLISNSLRYRSADRPARVVVDAVIDAAQAPVFRVSDAGIGIEPRHAHRIFGMFQRLHSVNEYEGTGIGLALVRRIVEDHGGRAWLDTDHEPGTRICFTLAPDPSPPNATAIEEH